MLETHTDITICGGTHSEESLSTCHLSVCVYMYTGFILAIILLGQGVNLCSEMMVRNSIVLPHKELGTNFKNEIIL